jgi:tRNA(fMet)-specific endonuclease VapC
MTSGNTLFDTNVLISFLEGLPEAVAQVGAASNPCISVITVGELAYGAQKSEQTAANERRFAELVRQFDVVSIDEQVAGEYGIAKAALAAANYKLPENDIWIAATAKASDSMLVTYDNHFKRVAGINLKLLS